MYYYMQNFSLDHTSEDVTVEDKTGRPDDWQWQLPSVIVLKSYRLVQVTAAEASVQLP